MKGWTCQRQTEGVRCGHFNVSRKRKCQRCGKAKPPRRRPAHLLALELSYEQYVELNGGEFCGICGAEPTDNRKLDRDHDHRTGRPRGLLCHSCNRTLSNRITQVWLRRAVAYLDRGMTKGMSDRGAEMYRRSMDAYARDPVDLPREL